MFRFLREDGRRGRPEIRHEAVVTFLALLEMAKLRLIAMQGPPQGDEVPQILIARASDDLRAAVARTVVGTEEYR